MTTAAEPAVASLSRRVAVLSTYPPTQCGLATLSPSTVSLVLGHEVASVRRARRFVEQECQRLSVGDDRCDDAVLMASELVTNAILHGRSETRIRVVSLTGQDVRVEVSDDNSRHPEPVSQDDAALDGRGLMIVESLCLQWGVRDEDIGKTVWFEV